MVSDRVTSQPRMGEGCSRDSDKTGRIGGDHVCSTASQDRNRTGEPKGLRGKLADLLPVSTG